MKTVFPILSWVFGCLFAALFFLGIWSRHYLPSLLILGITVLLIPPIREQVRRIIRIPLPGWLIGLLIPILLLLFIYLLFRGMGNPYSIYRSPGIEQGLMSIYESRMTHWPVPYESRYIETRYGTVYVVMSGPRDGPPILLLHASAMASWSWMYNIEGLNTTYRTYAIDTIGDAGRSVLDDMESYPRDGNALAELYGVIMDSLGVQSACIIGASQGGFITTNMALHMPERVDKIVLCGPMGYAGTNASVLRILFTTLFPVKPVQDSATRWAFGDDHRVIDAVEDWFQLILTGVISRQARPKPFTEEQLRRLKVPVLLLLGERDGLVGNPERTIHIARCIPKASVEILDTGHLISAEEPDRFNTLVMDFIESPME